MGEKCYWWHGAFFEKRHFGDGLRRDCRSAVRNGLQRRRRPCREHGVHEHWNNVEEKLYSRNTGKAEGIELVRIYGNTRWRPMAGVIVWNGVNMKECGRAHFISSAFFFMRGLLHSLFLNRPFSEQKRSQGNKNAKSENDQQSFGQAEFVGKKTKHRRKKQETAV